MLFAFAPSLVIRKNRNEVSENQEWCNYRRVISMVFIGLHLSLLSFLHNILML